MGMGLGSGSERLLRPPGNLERMNERYASHLFASYEASEHGFDADGLFRWTDAFLGAIGPLPRGSTLLDFGSGYGQLTWGLGARARSHGINVIGYDPASATDSAIERYSNSNTAFVKRKAAIAERSCAAAVSARAFCALEDPQAEIDYVFSRLEGGAPFVAADGIFRAEGLSAGLTGDEFTKHVEKVRRNQLVGPDAPLRAKRLMEKAGFHVQGVRRADHLFEQMGCEGYIILARRPI
jgi:predicted nuclease with RNAse H fold